MSKDIDIKRKFMERALRLAANGHGYVEPNPMVGALLVRENEVLGEGFHRRFGSPHAETEAIKNAKASGHDTSGAELYVTLEPCTHQGKTPPCSEAIIKSGIKKVYIAAEDPMWESHATHGTRNCGRGMDTLRKAGIEVETGICCNSAVIQNAAFYKKARLNMPLTIAKWAMSADGKIATRTGSSRWISCPQSRTMVHELRGRTDAVIIGYHTAACDNPTLTCRDVEKRRTAERIVLCGKKVPSPESKLVRTAKEIPVIIAFPEASPPHGLEELERKGCEPMPLTALEQSSGKKACPAALLHCLSKRGASSVLIEGGSSVLGSFFDCDLVDQALVFAAPFIIGGDSALSPVGGEGVENIRSSIPFKGTACADDPNNLPDRPPLTVKIVGKDILLTGWIHDPGDWYGCH